MGCKRPTKPKQSCRTTEVEKEGVVTERNALSLAARLFGHRIEKKVTQVRLLIWFMILAALGGTRAAAAQAPIDQRQFCNAVADQILSQAGIRFLQAADEGTLLPAGRGFYAYEAMLRAAAGVSEGDTPEIEQRKMQVFWLANRESFACFQLGFSMPGGNVFKLAMEKNSNHVVNDFIRRWQLDMNFVDPSDGKTPLDYIEDQLSGALGSNLEPVFRRYRDLLVRHGAKHSNEL